MTQYYCTDVIGGRAVDEMYPVCFASLFECGGIYCGENIGFNILTPGNLNVLGAVMNPPADGKQLWSLMNAFLIRFTDLLDLRIVESTETWIEFKRPKESVAGEPGHAYGMVAFMHACRMATPEGGYGGSLAATIALYLDAIGAERSELSVSKLTTRELIGIVTIAGKLFRVGGYFSSAGIHNTFAQSSSDNGTIFSGQQYGPHAHAFKQSVDKAMRGVPEFSDGEYDHYDDNEAIPYHEVTTRGYRCAMPSAGGDVWDTPVYCPVTGERQGSPWGATPNPGAEQAEVLYSVACLAYASIEFTRWCFFYPWDEVPALMKAMMSVFLKQPKVKNNEG